MAEICQRIRGLSTGGYTYIILVVDRSSWTGLISGFEDDFVLEPVDPQELKARLQIGTRVLSLHNTLTGRSEMLNEFAYTIGHDIKTTVVAMTMTSEEALEGTFGLGSVTVSIARRDSMLSIEIPDTGSGIGADEASKTFTPLALSSARRRYAGFGLGMYLCRLIVESHNGTIRYDSRPNGGNYVCEFSLAQQA